MGCPVILCHKWQKSQTKMLFVSVFQTDIDDKNRKSEFYPTEKNQKVGRNRKIDVNITQGLNI